MATPHMNELGKRLTRLMSVQYGLRIEAIERTPQGWMLRDNEEHNFGPYDRVITALPAPQAAALLASEPDFAEQLRAQQFHACWAAMATLAEPLPVDFGGAFINSGNISWMARNQTKPGRAGNGESLVLHATPEWTAAHFESDKAHVAEELLQELWPQLGLTAPLEVTSCDAHRWMYARPVMQTPLPHRCLFNADRTLIACGDWASGGRVEGAFMSGAAAVGILSSSFVS